MDFEEGLQRQHKGAIEGKNHVKIDKRSIHIA